METKTLHFVVDGRFISNLARNWLFYENKPYSVCIDLLCKCLVNKELSQEEREILADKILFGGADLIGNSEKGIKILNVSDDWIKIKQEWIDSLINEKESNKTVIKYFASQKVRLLDSLGYWSCGNIDDCLNCLNDEDGELKQKILDIMKRRGDYLIKEKKHDSLNIKEICNDI